MSVSSLFAVNDYGRVYSLQTGDALWKELHYLGVDFKRVSAHDSVVWALGGDHQIYVYMHGISVPIRVQEEVYENQRWNPLKSYCADLLPTDRPKFSSADGMRDRDMSHIRLPTLAWYWEDDWQIQYTFEGRALDKEGWTYAIDFPQTYTIEKKWNSCVRRRKWSRYRRYRALNTWSIIPAIHRDYTQDPFIDICVGGGNISGQDPQVLMVWGVTVSSKIVVREGVSGTCPEGLQWKVIDTPFDQEITMLSIGRTGRLWAVTWKGELLVRNGITRTCPAGSTWLRVDCPHGIGVHSIAVGENVVWVVGRDHSVWFRRGLDETKTYHVGASWLSMMGSLSTISVGPNDQVWAVEYESNHIVVRTGISRCELTGKSWRQILLPLKPQRQPILTDSSSLSDQPSLSSQSQLKDDWRANVLEKSESHDSETPPTERTNPVPEVPDMPEDVAGPEASDPILHDPLASLGSSTVSDTPVDYFGSDYVEQVEKESFQPPWEMSRSATNDQTELTCADMSNMNLSTDQPMIAKDLDQPLDDVSMVPDQLLEEASWVWVSGGGCWIQCDVMPKWFVTERKSTPLQPWKTSIMTKLRKRDEREIVPFQHYEKVGGQTPWVVEGECRLLVAGRWSPATVSLEMVGSKKADSLETALVIKYTSQRRKEISMPCGRIVLTQLNACEASKCLVSIYCVSLATSPIVLCFSAEKFAQDWTDHISAACHSCRGYKTLPDTSRAMWALTSTGQIYVHELDSSEIEMHAEMVSAQYQLQVDRGKTPFIHALIRGFRPGCFVVATLQLKHKPTRFHINFATTDPEQPRIALHINPRFNDQVVVFNTKEKDGWGAEETKPLFPLEDLDIWEVSVLCDDNDIKVSINDKITHRYKHRTDVTKINQIEISGDVNIKSVEYNCGACDRTPSDLFWRKVGGHLKQCEAGALGVVWGLSYDSQVYVYTGAATTDNNDFSPINIMNDVRHMHIWENQRWNPITGFTNRLLATDRPGWSDESGKVALSKTKYKLSSQHWQWVGDWTVCFDPPGGVDKEGWQFATDFPMGYHPYMYVTDLVRRRRWQKKSRLTTLGPWKQMQKVSLICVSVANEATLFNMTPVWGVTVTHEVVYREGVTREVPEGIEWCLISSDSPMVSICASSNVIWAVSTDGRAHLRIGVTKETPKGSSWVNVDAPATPLKQVSAGGGRVWAVDQTGGLYLRTSVQPLFPEGIAWTRVCGDVTSISVGSNAHLWAVLAHYTKDKQHLSGVLAKRTGISAQRPTGTGWDLCPGTDWSSVSSRMK